MDYRVHVLPMIKLCSGHKEQAESYHICMSKTSGPYPHTRFAFLSFAYALLPGQ